MKKKVASGLKKKLNVAVVGATGLVGGAFLKLIERRGFQFDNLHLFASERSKNVKMKFMGETFIVDDVKNYKKHRCIKLFFVIHSYPILLTSQDHQQIKIY